jgi:hypothetical protein
MTKKPFKLRMEPHKPNSGSLKTSDKIEYFTSLLRLMILEDIGRSSAPTIAVEDTGLIRRLPVLNVKFLNPLSRRLKSEQETDITRKMSPTDNPFLTKLQAEWVGKILYDGGFYRIIAIQYVPNTGNTRYPCWEATSEPVYKENGEYIVHKRHVAIGEDGSNITLKSSLVGFALAEYGNGDNADPVSLPYATFCHIRFLQREARQATASRSAPAPSRKRAQPLTASARSSGLRRRKEANTIMQDTAIATPQ